MEIGLSTNLLFASSIIFIIFFDSLTIESKYLLSKFFFDDFEEFILLFNFIVVLEYFILKELLFGVKLFLFIFKEYLFFSTFLKA